jgi:hypothetical protein
MPATLLPPVSAPLLALCLPVHAILCTRTALNVPGIVHLTWRRAPGWGIPPPIGHAERSVALSCAWSCRYRARVPEAERRWALRPSIP